MEYMIKFTIARIKLKRFCFFSSMTPEKELNMLFWGAGNFERKCKEIKTSDKEKTC
jgi:hypothetical protein